MRFCSQGRGKAARKAVGSSELLSLESGRGGDFTEAVAVCGANSPYRKSPESLRKTEGPLQKGPESEGQKTVSGDVIESQKPGTA